MTAQVYDFLTYHKAKYASDLLELAYLDAESKIEIVEPEVERIMKSVESFLEERDGR